MRKNNAKLKRVLIWGTVIFGTFLLSTFVYLEIDSRIYIKKIKEMDVQSELNYKMETPVKHKILKIHNTEIHYYMSGMENNELVLFLHPAFSDHRAFGQQIDSFSKNYRVITIDMIGHGLSKAHKSKEKIDATAQHIHEIITTEGFDKVHLVGVSVGALLAQYFALEFPGKVKSLTALGGYSINKENPEVAKAQRSLNMKLLFRALFSMNAFRKAIAPMTCSTEVGQALFFQSTSHYERKSFMLMQGLRHVIKNRENPEPGYPLLILVGKDDLELAKKMARAWHSECKTSEYSLINEAGHCANIDASEAFNAITLDFIARNN